MGDALKLWDQALLRMSQWSQNAKMALMMTVDALLLLFLSATAVHITHPDIGLSVKIVAALGALSALPVFFHFGLYRQIIRYITEQALVAIIKSALLVGALWLLWLWILFPDWLVEQRIATAWIFGLSVVAVIGGLRLWLRVLLWRPLQRQYGGRQALIYGANDAGWQLVSALRQTREFFPAAFVDDDPATVGKELGGVTIYAPADIPLLLKRYQIQEAIVALPQASEYKRRQVVELLTQYNLRVRIMPPVADFAAGRFLPRIIREVDVGDLLGRNRVEPDWELLRKSVTNRNVIVTGAGGSIGSELCRQIALLSPKKLILVEANEFALYKVQQELLEIGFKQIVPALGSVEDQIWLESLIEKNRVCTVFHAAAYKHVPLVEQNPIAGVQNNVLGTYRVVAACQATGVERFILISSDKAVNPTNIMGATKRWAELITLAAAQEMQQKGAAFSIVRFGNVLGSSGSVVPLFQRQIKKGGPITVTHPEVTRYFMSIHEAVELVLQASSMSRGGEVFLLDMGEPVSILELARKLIRLAGLTERNENNPNGDIEIIFVGLRPGEKLHEELVIGQNVSPTAHPKIRQAMEPYLLQEQVLQVLSELELALKWRDEEKVKKLLFSLVFDPYYTGQYDHFVSEKR